MPVQFQTTSADWTVFHALSVEVAKARYVVYELVCMYSIYTA